MYNTYTEQMNATYVPTATPSHVVSAVSTVATGQIFFPVLRFSPVTIIPPSPIFTVILLSIRKAT